MDDFFSISFDFLALQFVTMFQLLAVSVITSQEGDPGSDSQRGWELSVYADVALKSVIGKCIFQKIS